MRLVQVITDYIRRSILTAQGDLVVRGATIPERLAAVAVGQVLKSAGVGALPAWGKSSILDLKYKIGHFHRNTSGDVVLSSLGFDPKLAIFFGLDDETVKRNVSYGFDDGTTHMCIYMYYNDSFSVYSRSESIYIRSDLNNLIIGSITNLGTDQLTITFTLTGVRGVNVIYLLIG